VAIVFLPEIAWLDSPATSWPQEGTNLVVASARGFWKMILRKGVSGGCAFSGFAGKIP
jgi:hypothetical protein